LAKNSDKPWWEKEHVIMSGPKSKTRTTEEPEPAQKQEEYEVKENITTDDERKKRLEAIEARLAKKR
jgi:hypothetical protein